MAAAALGRGRCGARWKTARRGAGRGGSGSWAEARASGEAAQARSGARCGWRQQAGSGERAEGKEGEVGRGERWRPTREGEKRERERELGWAREKRKERLGPRWKSDFSLRFDLGFK